MSVHSIFRRQVIESAGRRLDGKVLVTSPISTWVYGALLVASLAIGLVFASTATYSRKATVSGWLTPEGGATRATAPRPGIVNEVLVEPGDIVFAGQPLASVDLPASAEGENVAANLSDILQNQLAAALTEHQAAIATLDAEEARVAQKLSSARTELAMIEAQLSTQATRIAKSKNTAEWARENFEQGLTDRADAETRENIVLQLEQESLAINRSRVVAQGTIADLNAQLLAISPARSEVDANYSSKKLAIHERLTRTSAEAGYVVASPIDGKVESVPIIVGQPVRAGSTMIAMTPSNSALHAELFIPSRAIGFVEAGQQVRIKYEAYPFQRFGAGDGTIIDVSGTILHPDEYFSPGLNLAEPVFKVLVQLESSQIEAYGESLPLKSGMKLSADIVLEKRSLMRWLMDPLYAVGKS